jgi:hypothetical protein
MGGVFTKLIPRNTDILGPRLLVLTNYAFNKSPSLAAHHHQRWQKFSKLALSLLLLPLYRRKRANSMTNNGKWIKPK